MPSLGELRIDLIADIGKFVSPFTTATSRMERFARDVARSLDSVEKSLQKAGTALAIRVTAPLAALSAVSIKAADANGNFADSLERLGLQARAALAPLGESLIDAFESIRPAIEDAVRFVNGLAQAFDELDEPAKRSIITIGAYAAATGPALIAAAGFFAVLKTGAAVTALLAATLTRLPNAIQAIGVVIGASSLGKFIGELTVVESRILKMISTVEVLQLAGITGVRGFVVTAIELFSLLKGAVLDVAAVIATKLATVLDVVGQNAAQVNSLLLGTGLGGLTPLVTGASAIAAELRGIAEDASDAAVDATAAWRTQATQIGIEATQSFADIAQRLKMSLDRAAAEGPTSFGEVLGERLENFSEFFGLDSAFDLFKDQIPAIERFNQLLARAREIAAGVKLPNVITKREREELEKLARELEKMEQAAERIRQRNDPTRVLRQELAEAQRLNALGVLSDEDFLAAAARIKKALDEIGDKADETLFDKIGKGIEGFSNRVSDAFADLVVDGRAAFDELGKAFLKMLVSITVQESIFGPLAKSLGGGFADIFRGPGTATNPTATPGAGNALGGIFAGGQKLAFAMGGVVSGPTTFPMAGGRTGLMGEAGPEAIMPLQRVNGYLGVRATGGGTVVNIIDQRRAGERPQVTESTGPDGRKQISILIRDEVKAAIADGSLDRVMGNSYGLGRRGGRR